MKRYCAIWFPNWPLDRLRRTKRAELPTPLQASRSPQNADGKSSPSAAQPKSHAHGTATGLARPFVLVEGGRRGLVIVAANTAAQAMAVTPGLAFTDACARCPGLGFEEIDRASDQRALRKLADWLVRFSPLIALDGSDGLLMETTGCDHLFGGEDHMLTALSSRLDATGYEHRLGLASTPAAAHGLARFAPQIHNKLEDGDERAGLADLPVAALRLSSEATDLLHRFGLTRIGQLYGLDRKSLARRFSSRIEADAVVLRLDQALGLRAEPLDPLRPAPHFCARLNCPEPIASTEGVLAGLETLTHQLTSQLDNHGLGARVFTFIALRTDGTRTCLERRTARPMRDAAHLLRLFSEHMDQLDPGFGIDLMFLNADRVDHLNAAPAHLGANFAAASADMDTIARLADRISAKLGEGRIQVISGQSSHMPEKAERLTHWQGEAPTGHAIYPKAGPRPLRLIEPPEEVNVLAQVPDGPPLRFIWRRIGRRAIKSDGPERISPEWWQLTTTQRRARDYYRVEDTDGHRYWLYRDGLYDDNRGGPPRWFVHGLFA